MLYLEIGILALLVVNLVILIIFLLKRKNTNQNTNTIDLDLDTKFNNIEKNINEKIIKEMGESRTQINNDFSRSLENYKNSTTELQAKLTTNLNESISRITTNLNESINKISNENQGKLNELSTRLTGVINDRLDSINKRVDERLDEGFKNTSDTFSKVTAQLTKIDEAQKNMEKLGIDVTSLKDILSNKKSRGALGETLLDQILYGVYGDNKKLYETQFLLPVKGRELIPDAVIKCPAPLNLLCIDSKFPLENYKKYMDSVNDYEKEEAKKAFKQDIIKKIKDISEKYIIEGVTSDIAIMFLPSEAIFAEINNNFDDLVTKANEKKIWFASPSTLIAVIELVKMASRNILMNEQAKDIKESLLKLAKEFDLFGKRWDSLVKNIDKVSSDTKDITTTTNKINKQFDSIKRVEGFVEISGDNNEN